MILKRAFTAIALIAALSFAGVCYGDTVMSKCNAEQNSYCESSLTLPLAMNWEFVTNRYDNNASAPIISEGIAYITSGEKVYAVDVKTGSFKWAYPVDGTLSGTIKATPLLHNGKLYFGATDGKLYCIDIKDGTFKWAFQTRGSVSCSPIVVDDVLYFGTNDNAVYAIDPETGDTVWNKPFTGRDDFSGSMAMAGGILVAACMDGHLYGISASTGRGARWVFRLPMAPIDSSPVISDGLVIMAVHNTMYGLTLRSGQLKWAVTLPFEVSATPAVSSDTIYVPCKDRKIYAYARDKKAPYLKWTAPAETGSIPVSAPLLTDNALYVTCTKGVVCAFSTDDGSLLWRYMFIPSPVTNGALRSCDAASSPVIYNESLYVMTDDGVLHSFKADATDTVEPISYNEVPFANTYLSGAPPLKFAATLYDAGSGVDFSTVTMSLNGKPLEYTVDYLTSTVTYTSNSKNVGKVSTLDNGRYKLTVTAKDYKGNSLVKEWFFNVDKRLVPPKSAIGAASDAAEGVTKDDTKNSGTSGDNSSQRGRGRGSRGGAVTGGNTTGGNNSNNGNNNNNTNNNSTNTYNNNNGGGNNDNYVGDDSGNGNGGNNNTEKRERPQMPLPPGYNGGGNNGGSGNNGTNNTNYDNEMPPAPPGM
ncbi:MAG: PQQ-binding-like beta-propeller repeat protein [Abditibacteriota bacterium]|nr:PQQ-binding-like beta-propeller repeat protein [Abditibacteriota bacterium]